MHSTERMMVLLGNLFRVHCSPLKWSSPLLLATSSSPLALTETSQFLLAPLYSNMRKFCMGGNNCCPQITKGRIHNTNVGSLLIIAVGLSLIQRSVVFRSIYKTLVWTLPGPWILLPPRRPVHGGDTGQGSQPPPCMGAWDRGLWCGEGFLVPTESIGEVKRSFPGPFSGGPPLFDGVHPVRGSGHNP